MQRQDSEEQETRALGHFCQPSADSWSLRIGGSVELEEEWITYTLLHLEDN